MRANQLMMSALLLSWGANGQPARTYVADTGERTARGIPAMFETWGTLAPHWSNHWLVGVQDNYSASPLIYLIDKSGNRDQFPFPLADAAVVYVHGLAVSANGTVAIAGAAVSGDSKAGSFLALVAPDRKEQAIVRTWPYVAWEVTFIPDGSLWTVGYTFHDTEDRIVKPNVLAHFDGGGKLLQSIPIVAKSRFGPRDSGALSNSFLRASGDRMGWFTNGSEYIEFSFTGEEIGRYDGPGAFDPDEVVRGSFAMSSSNEVLYGTIENASVRPNSAPVAPQRRTWSLDRQKRRWVPTEFSDESLPGWGSLLGFDGDTLVTTGAVHEMRRYVPANQTKAQ
jgi:hypothetical protein